MVTCCKLITLKFLHFLLHWRCHPTSQPLAAQQTLGLWYLPPSGQILCEVAGPWRCTPLLLGLVSPILDALLPKNPKPAHAVTCVPNQRGQQASAESPWRAVGPNARIAERTQTGNGHTQANVPTASQANTHFPVSNSKPPSGSNEEEPSTEHHSHNPPSAGTACRNETFRSRERADLQWLPWGAQNLEHQWLENQSREKAQGQSC